MIISIIPLDSLDFQVIVYILANNGYFVSFLEIFQI